MVVKLNVLFFVIKDSSLQNSHFSRISLDCFSPSSKAIRRSFSTSGDAITIEAGVAQGHFHQMNQRRNHRYKESNLVYPSSFVLAGIPHAFVLATITIQPNFQGFLYSCHVVYIPCGAEKLCVSFCNNWSYPCFSFDSIFIMTSIYNLLIRV